MPLGGGRLAKLAFSNEEALATRYALCDVSYVVRHVTIMLGDVDVDDGIDLMVTCAAATRMVEPVRRRR